MILIHQIISRSKYGVKVSPTLIKESDILEVFKRSDDDKVFVRVLDRQDNGFNDTEVSDSFESLCSLLKDEK